MEKRKVAFHLSFNFVILSWEEIYHIILSTCDMCVVLGALTPLAPLHEAFFLLVLEPQHPRDDRGRQVDASPQRDGCPHLRGEEVPARGRARRRRQRQEVRSYRVLYCKYVDAAATILAVNRGFLQSSPLPPTPASPSPPPRT